MTKHKSSKQVQRLLRECRDEDRMIRELRSEIVRLADKVKEERRQRHLVEEELAFVRQQQVEQVRRRLNGVMR